MQILHILNNVKANYKYIYLYWHNYNLVNMYLIKINGN